MHLQDIECEAELILATLMESQQAEPLSQQGQAGPAGRPLGAAPGSVGPGDTPAVARGQPANSLAVQVCICRCNPAYA